MKDKFVDIFIKAEGHGVYGYLSMNEENQYPNVDNNDYNTGLTSS